MKQCNFYREEKKGDLREKRMFYISQLRWKKKLEERSLVENESFNMSEKQRNAFLLNTISLLSFSVSIFHQDHEGLNTFERVIFIERRSVQACNDGDEVRAI